MTADNSADERMLAFLLEQLTDDSSAPHASAPLSLEALLAGDGLTPEPSNGPVPVTPFEPPKDHTYLSPQVPQARPAQAPNPEADLEAFLKNLDVGGSDTDNSDVNSPVGFNGPDNFAIDDLDLDDFDDDLFPYPADVPRIEPNPEKPLWTETNPEKPLWTESYLERSPRIETNPEKPPVDMFLLAQEWGQGDPAGQKGPRQTDVKPEWEAEAGQKDGKPPTPGRKVFRVFSNILFWLICLSLIAGAFLFASSNDPRKSYFGYRTYNVLTDSMTPNADGSSPPGGFNAGDMIIVQMCQAEDIKIGDIITFNPSPQDEGNTLFLTHRVVDILPELGGKEGIYFVTKGDHNNSEDPPISGEMLIGKKVGRIPGLGAFLEKIAKNFWLAIAFVVCFFMFIIMLRWYFAAPKEKGKKKPDKRKSPPTLSEKQSVIQPVVSGGGQYR